MSATSDIAVAGRGIHRDPLTWYCYLALGYFSYLSCIQGNIIPFLKVELGLSYAEVSLHASAVAAGALMVGLFGDRGIRRFGRRRMLTVGLIGGGTGIALLSVSGAAWQSIGSCLVMGAFGSLAPALMWALLVDLQGDRRDVAYAEANAMCYAFALAAPLIYGLAVWAGLSWRTAPLAGAIAGFAIAIGFIRMPVPEPRVAAVTSEGRLPLAFWVFWLMLMLSVGAEFSSLLWAPSYFGQIVGLPTSLAAICAGLFFAGMLIGRTVSIRLVRMFSLRTLTFGAIIVGFIGFAAYWLPDGQIVAVCGLFVIGLGVAMLYPLSLGFAMTAAGTAAPRASARLLVASSLAILVNPPLLGTIADHAGLWLAQLMIPVFLALALVAFLVGDALTRRAAV